ncbi:hypothetical protein ACWEOI_34810 [Nocardia sp. NPDC004340]
MAAAKGAAVAAPDALQPVATTGSSSASASASADPMPWVYAGNSALWGSPDVAMLTDVGEARGVRMTLRAMFGPPGANPSVG